MQKWESFRPTLLVEVDVVILKYRSPLHFFNSSVEREKENPNVRSPRRDEGHMTRLHRRLLRPVFNNIVAPPPLVEDFPPPATTSPSANESCDLIYYFSMPSCVIVFAGVL
jgi:hypothetical protein